MECVSDRRSRATHGSGAPDGGLRDWGAPSSGTCNRAALDRPLVGGLPEQVLEGTPRPVIPGPRVDPRCLDADAIAVRTMTGRIDLGNAVQERAIEGGQLFGGRLLVHRRQDGLFAPLSE